MVGTAGEIRTREAGGEEARVARRAARWSARLAWATALAALPLVVFGGLVTTLRAGMAIDGWLVLEPGRGDHFLLFYPVEKWFRDSGTFTEHTHRLFGTLVGVLAVATVVAAFLERAGRARWVASLALLAVCGQGLLGGLRVLEASSELAFLHGAAAQAVFALLTVSALSAAGDSWAAIDRRAGELPAAGTLLPLAWALLGAVYATIVVGAWTRHSGSHGAFGLHVVLVAVVLPLALATARGLRSAAERAGTDLGAELRGLRLRLQLALGAQIVLGILAAVGVFAFSGGFEGAVSLGELVFATLHVLFGALLLAQCALLVCWLHRYGARSSPRASASTREEAFAAGRLSP